MTQPQTKPATTLLRRALYATTMLTAGLAMPALAQEALPSGGAVAAGDAAVSVSAGGLRIDQTSNRAVINWNSFSVGAGRTVEFRQPDAQSATLNRVLGTTASTIAGQVSANGAVYLVNPNGIAITESGTVDVGGGFVATTLDIADADFMAGKASFTGKGASARVSNAGRITAGQGGYVALLGGSAANSGTITVPLGQLGLGSGEQIALDINGGNFLQVAVPSSVVTGSNALIDNSGTITVAGGAVSLKAAVLKDAVRNVINMSGSISADSAVGNGGTIHLIGGADTASMAGQVTVSGSLSARATGATGEGGFIETSGAKIDLNGVQVSTTAANGKAGTWLIDPVDFTIAASGGDITGAALGANLNSTSVVILSSNGASGTNGDVNVNDAINWATGNSLTLKAARNINIDAPITGANGTLFVDAVNSIAANAGITLRNFWLLNGAWVQNSPVLPNFSVSYDFRINGGTFLRASGGDGSAAAPWLIGDSFGLQGMMGFLASHFALSRDIDAASTVSWTGGSDLATVHHPTSYGWVGSSGFRAIGDPDNPFTGSLDGRGHTINGLFIRTGLTLTTGLFGVIGAAGSVRDLTLSNGSVYGTSPTAAPSVGGLAGRNYGTISGVISNLAVTGEEWGVYDRFPQPPTYPGYTSVVGLELSVGGMSVGGLVGQNFGSIVRSGATGAVLANSDHFPVEEGTGKRKLSLIATTNVGGLAGLHLGSIRQSYATGSVTGFGNPNDASTYPTAVYAGGLVGQSVMATISQSFASGGAVLAKGGSPFIDYMLVNESYLGGVAYAGGLAGSIIGGSVDNVYAYNRARAIGGDNGQYVEVGPTLGYANPLTPIALYGTIINAYAPLPAESLSGRDGSGFQYLNYDQLPSTSTVRGLIIGSESFSLATFVNAGWDIDSLGGTDSIWRIYEGLTGPLLRTFLTPLTLTAKSETLTYNGQVQTIGYSVPEGADLAKILGTPVYTGGTGTNVGTYTGTLTGGLYSTQLGYDLSYAGHANLSITPRPLSIYYQANAASRMYGFNNPALSGSVTYEGLLDPSHLSGTATWTTAAKPWSDVGSYAITGSGLTATSNYTVQAFQSRTGAGAYDNASALTITKAPLTITYKASLTSMTYGDAVPGFLSSTTYVFAPGSVYAADPGLPVYTTTATSQSPVGQYAITGSTNLGSNARNYDLTEIQAPGNATALTINPRAITITADALSRYYGDANPTLTYTVGGKGLVNGDALPGALATSATTTSDVGDYAITQGSLSGGSNYTITTFTGANLTVTPRPLSIYYQADAATRMFGFRNPAFTGSVSYEGLIDPSHISGTAVWTTPAIAQSHIGSYAITGSGLSATSNYTVQTFQSRTGPGAYDNSTALTITKAPVTVSYTASPTTATYGDAIVLRGGSASGNFASGTVFFVFPDLGFTTTATSQSPVGQYAINGTVSFGAYTNDYDITEIQAPGNATALTITPRAITITADALSRLYGDANPALTYTVGGKGLVNNDALSGALATSATGTSGVGDYAITQGTLSGGSNYTISYIGALLSVTPRPITITADALSRYYGDVNPALTYTVGGKGLMNNDVLSGALATSASVTSNVGDYAITQGTLSGGSNYTITNYTGANLSVTPRPLTVTYTATPVSRPYGDPNPLLAGSYTSVGLVNGDTLGGSAVWETPASVTSNVGSYAITGSGLTASSNYALTSVQDKGNAAALTITPRALTVVYTANPVSRTYGDANPALSGSYTSEGLVNGDSLSGFVSWTTSARASTPVGSYAILGSGLEASSNYAVTSVQAKGNAAALTITPRPITINAYAKVRTYGDANPALTYWIGGRGLVNGDRLSGALATSATTASNVGTYAITQGNLAASSNYAVSYTGADLTILPRPLTITYTATAASRTYGDANPALSGSYTAVGLVNGDTLGGAAAWTTTATSATGVGSYRITGAGLTASANYRLSTVQAAGNATALTINPRAITITANDLTRYYGSPNPALTYTVGGQGLVNGDTLVGALGTSATPLSAPGTYAITRGSLWASPNYVVTFIGAKLTIVPR